MDTADWQTWAALGIVAFTVLLLAARSLSKKSKGCGSCGCGSQAKQKPKH